MPSVLGRQLISVIPAEKRKVPLTTVMVMHQRETQLSAGAVSKAGCLMSPRCTSA